jgi:hypothetical protein
VVPSFDEVWPRLIRLLLAGEGPSTRKLFNTSLRDLGLVGNREPIWVSKEAPAIQAFEKMRQHAVRSIAVVHEGIASPHPLLLLLVLAMLRPKLLTK